LGISVGLAGECVLYGHGKLKNYPFFPIYLTGNIPLQFIVFLCLVIIAQFAVVYVLITQEKAVASNLANALEATWEEELNSPGAMSLYQNWVSWQHA